MVEADLYELGIITKVTGGSDRTRRRLANGQETRAFLEAALDLTNEVLGPPNLDTLRYPEEEDQRPILSYLSRRKVLARAQVNCGRDYPLSESMLRHRWGYHGDFLTDFVSYALADKYLRIRAAITSHASELLTADEDFAGAVHQACYQDLLLVCQMPSFRFQLLAIATAPAQPSSAQALEQMYGKLSEIWVELYSQVLEHYGFRFRPGIDIDDFNIMLQALSEGLAIRMVAGTQEGLVNHETRSSLLGSAVLALFSALIDPGDGLSVEEHVTGMMRQRHQT